jgi:hypothetical protein
MGQPCQNKTPSLLKNKEFIIMADEAIIPTAEEIAGQEGSIETLENATLVHDEPRLVPERDLLAVKDKAQRKDNELKEARARIAELEAGKSVSPLAAEFE